MSLTCLLVALSSISKWRESVFTGLDYWTGLDFDLIISPHFLNLVVHIIEI